MDFVDHFAAVGLDNPIDPEFVKTLSETLYERMDIEGRTEELSRAKDTLSRAMLIQMLYDQAVESTVTSSTFADVAPYAWYANAVAWAVDAGILAGVDDARLDPQSQTTRVGAAAMLLRTAWLER